jgi:hypothetical protein
MPMFLLPDTVLSILILSWAAWFMLGLARYILNHGDEIDQRLQSVSR